MTPSRIIIGLGNKARQGKDLTASLMQKKLGEEMTILHFARSLYDECINSDRKYPLIKSVKDGSGMITSYLVFDHKEDCADGYVFKYNIISPIEAPYIHQMFIEQNIDQYMGMDEKDGRLLQWWGTQYRRSQSDTYWIDKISEEISGLPQTIKYVLIPDTRFQNEYKFVKDNSGYFVRLERYNADGSRFIAGDRDPKHESETGLDNINPDYVIAAKTGEIELIELSIEDLLNKIGVN